MSEISPANDYRPSPLAAVRRESVGGRWALTLTRDLGHPLKRVWEVITEPGQLRQWAPYSSDRDLAATGPVVLSMQDRDQGQDQGQDQDGGAWRLPGTVITADSPRVLEYTWGADVLRWQLTGTDDGTTLTLRQTFDQESLTSSLAAGWHLCLDAADALMKGVPFGPVVGERALDFGWVELNERYAEVLDVKPTPPHG